MTDELYTVYTNIYQLIIDFGSLSKQINHKPKQTKTNGQYQNEYCKRSTKKLNFMCLMLEKNE